MRIALKNYEPQKPPVSDVALRPLTVEGVFGAHLTARVGDELLFSNDQLIGPPQPYPGARLPDLNGRTRFPAPDRPGEYCSREEFERAPKYMAQFVHWPSRVQCVLEGRYADLRPVHFEGIFTLVCNFMCPHCTRRVTRTDWVEGGAWDNNTPIDERNTMHPEGLRRALDEAAAMRVDGQMGIVWGGGDPTANPFTYAGMLYAKRAGITSSFLTNGVFLDVNQVLDSEPILVRISLNCGTEEAYRRFHGYPKGWDYFDRVKVNMRALAREKLRRRSRTLIGVSLIADERNMDDMVAATEEIRAVVADAGPGIDYVIIRPVMNYAHFKSPWAILESDTKQRAWDLAEAGGPIRTILDELGIPLVPIKDSFEPPPPPESYDDDTRCLAYGMFSEMRHNGDVQLCSDSYGNPEYTVGNLFQNTLEEIWSSERRQQVLDAINRKACFKTTCPHNSRGHHYNRLFHQIEKLRLAGRIDVVTQWMDDLRDTTLPLGHSFFT